MENQSHLPPNLARGIPSLQLCSLDNRASPGAVWVWMAGGEGQGGQLGESYHEGDGSR